MFEEERDTGGAALFLNGGDPFLFQGPGTGAAFAADDDPVDAGEVEGAEVFQQGFDGEEFHGGSGAAEGIDAGQAVAAVFHGDAPPDVRGGGGIGEATGEQFFHAVGALGENLVSVPVGEAHDGGDFGYVVLRDVLMEEVTHGIDEDAARRGPLQRIGQLFRDKAEIESKLEWVSFDPAPAFREGLRIAMGAPGADLGAATHRVPRRVGPFDF